jgi:pimeloyl-ACP methyl ester carboxylesterase
MKVLFVHGALVRDGQWWWHRMVEPLAQRGMSTEAVVLPSCEGAFSELKDMYADVTAAVSAAVTVADEPIIFCGHSYGGAVITEAGTDESKVQHLIYITSVLPESGQSHADAVGAGPAPWVQPQPDGTVVLRSDRFESCSSPTATTQRSPKRLPAPPRSPSRRSGSPCIEWPGAKSPQPMWSAPRIALYRLLTNGRTPRRPPGSSLACGHHPFLSQPKALAQIIADSAGPPH